MARQLRLSIFCAASFLVVLGGLPLANYFFPEVMSRPIAGFPLCWLLLGVCFFPAVWLIAAFFIQRSIQLEDEEVREVQIIEGGKSKARSVEDQ